MSVFGRWRHSDENKRPKPQLKLFSNIHVKQAESKPGCLGEGPSSKASKSAALRQALCFHVCYWKWKPYCIPQTQCESYMNSHTFHVWNSHTHVWKHAARPLTIMGGACWGPVSGQGGVRLSLVCPLEFPRPLGSWTVSTPGFQRPPWALIRHGVGRE